MAPSAALEAAIEELLAKGLGDGERLAEIGRLGARLVLQRAVEEEVTAFLGRARYERTPEARGSRNGNRARQVQTAEGELEIQVPQIRGAAERFVSSVIPNGRTALRTRPASALPGVPGSWPGRGPTAGAVLGRDLPADQAGANARRAHDRDAGVADRIRCR